MRLCVNVMQIRHIYIYGVYHPSDIYANLHAQTIRNIHRIFNSDVAIECMALVSENASAKPDHA